MHNDNYSEFETQVEETFPGISASELNRRKDQHFTKWLRTQVFQLK